MTFPTIPTAGNGRLLAGTNASTTQPRATNDISGLTKNSGDLLIVIFIGYNAAGSTNQWSGWTSGWTEFIDRSSSSQLTIGAAYKWSTGSETGAVEATQASTVTGHAAWILLSIEGAHASTPPEVSSSFTTGTVSAIGVPSLNPSGWDVEDTLWIAVGASGETSTSGSYTGITAGPASYTDYADTGISGDVIGGTEGAVAFLQSAAASEGGTGSTFTVDLSSARNTATLIAVRPAPAAPTHQAAVTMTAASTLSTNAVAGRVAAVAMTAQSTLTADATVTGVPVYQGTVTMTASSVLAAGALRTALPSVAMTALSTLTVAGVREIPASVAMTAPSVLAADATITQGSAPTPATWVATSASGDNDRSSAVFPSHPAGVVNGDWIVAAIHHYDGGTIAANPNTAPSGFTHLGGVTETADRFGGTIRTDVFVKKIASGDPANFTFTFPTRFGNQAALYVHNVDPALVASSLTAVFAQNGTQSTTVPSVATGSPAAGFIAWFVNANDSDVDQAFSPPTGFTERHDGQWHSAASLDDASANVTASGATSSQTNNFIAATVAFPGTPGGGGTTYQAAVTMTAPSSLAANAVAARASSVTMTAPSSLTVAALITAMATVTMTAPSTLAAGALRTALPSVAMTAPSTLTANAVRVQPAAVAMTIPSTLVTGGFKTTAGAVNMTIPSVMTANATAGSSSFVSMTAPSTLSVAAFAARAATVNMTAPSTLVTAGLRTTQASVTMTAASVLVVAAIRIQLATVAMTAPSSLASGIFLQRAAAVVMTAASTLLAAATVSTPSTSPFFLWNGTIEIPLTVTIWNGATEDTVTAVEVAP